MTTKIALGIAMFAFVFSFMASPAKAVEVPQWTTTGDWDIAFEYNGTDYVHDLTLSQDLAGNLTGAGGHPANAVHAYAWALTSGSVSGNDINFSANYTAGVDALVPLTTLVVTGTIANDGTMSGTWSDNYQGGERTGLWHSTGGTALAINYGPTLGEITDKTIPELSLYTFTAEAEDDDNDALTFSLAGVVPAGASITGVGVFTWTPSEAQGAGDYTFTVVVSDGVLSDSEAFTIHVTEVADEVDDDDDEDQSENLPEDKNDCKKGGWKNYTDPRTDKMFKNQGQCVSWINHQ